MWYKFSTLPLYQELNHGFTLYGHTNRSKRVTSIWEHPGCLPYLCTKNETMTSLHVATLTVKRELFKIIYPTSDQEWNCGSTSCGHTNSWKRATIIFSIKVAAEQRWSLREVPLYYGHQTQNQTQLLKLIEAVPYRLVLELYFPFPHNRRTNTASKLPLIWTINI